MGRATEYITDFIERSSMHALTDAERATVKKTVGNALMELVLDNVEELNTRHEDPNAREPRDAASIEKLSDLVLELAQTIRAEQGTLGTEDGMDNEQRDNEETARHAIWNMMRDTGQAMPGVTDAEMVTEIDAKITEMIRAFVVAHTRYDMVDPTGMGLIRDEFDTDEERDTAVQDERESSTNTKDACDDCCAACNSRHTQTVYNYPNADMVVALSIAEGLRYPADWLSTCPYCKQENCQCVTLDAYARTYKCDNCDMRWVVTVGG